MDIAEQTRGAYRITTDRARLDVPLIHKFLSEESYWATGRTLGTVQTSIDHWRNGTGLQPEISLKSRQKARSPNGPSDANLVSSPRQGNKEKVDWV